MITVMMPCYNNLEYVGESIRSILDQTYSDFELIVVDDCSEEPVFEFVKGFDDSRIRLYKNEKRMKVPATLNKIMKLARGDYFCRQDSDDLSEIRRLERQVRNLNDGYEFVITRCEKMNEDSKFIEDEWMKRANACTASEVKSKLHEGNLIVGGSPMWSRKVFDKIGFFDPVMKVAQDYNYWLRIIKFFEVCKIKNKLYFHRKHENSHRKFTEQYLKEDGIQMDYNSLARERAESHPIIKEAV